MRCSCKNCGTYMVHSEREAACVCPDCGERCAACLGANTLLSREQLRELSGTLFSSDAPNEE